MKRTHYGFEVVEIVKGNCFEGIKTQCGIRFSTASGKEVDNVTSNLAIVDCGGCRRSIRSIVKGWK